MAIQVLCQCREDLVSRSLESLRGARHAIFHLYNSTSPAQRRYVFGLDQPGIVRIADRAWNNSSGRAARSPPRAPGSGWNTPGKLRQHRAGIFAGDLRGGVRRLEPTIADPIILNLPVTVEYATPNVHADQIEWMCGRLSRRAATIVSLHTHNDRGTGVAATELACWPAPTGWKAPSSATASAPAISTS